MLTSATQRGVSCWSSGVLRVDDRVELTFFLKKGLASMQCTMMYHGQPLSSLERTDSDMENWHIRVSRYYIAYHDLSSINFADTA